MDLPRTIDSEETILVCLARLRDLCAADNLPAALKIIQNCLKRCETLYVERRRRAFRDQDPDLT